MWIVKKKRRSGLLPILPTPGVFPKRVGVSTSTNEQSSTKKRRILCRTLDRTRKAFCISGNRKWRYRCFKRRFSLGCKKIHQPGVKKCGQLTAHHLKKQKKKHTILNPLNENGNRFWTVLKTLISVGMTSISPVAMACKLFETELAVY